MVKVVGNLVASEGMVRVSVQGRVEGEIRAPHIVIDGEVVGDVHASGHLELGARGTGARQPVLRADGNGHGGADRGSPLPFT